MKNILEKENLMKPPKIGEIIQTIPITIKAIAKRIIPIFLPKLADSF